METDPNRHAGRPQDSVTILPSGDVKTTLASIGRSETAAVMLDPWYNRGTGGVRNGYDAWLAEIVELSLEVACHVFVLGVSGHRVPRD